MKKFWLTVLIICTICTYAKVTVAQFPNLKFDHITSKNGLPQNSIFGIVKDKYGFMWFGTWDGLCRYDGYSFKTYKYNPQQKTSINNNRINNIIKDKDQNIWILTFDDKEICRYNYENDNFDRIPSENISESFLKLLNRRQHYQTVNFSYKQYRWSLDINTSSLMESSDHANVKLYKSNPSNSRSLNDNEITDLYKDNHNILWVGTFNRGINKADLKAKPFDYYYHNPLNPNSIIDNNVRAICEDNMGNLWVGTRDKGITVISADGSKYTTYHKERQNTITDNQIRRLFCDSRGIIWIGTKDGLENYNPKTGTFRNFSKWNLNRTVFGIAEDHQHNILIGSWNGVYKYIPAEDRLIHLNPDKTLLNPHVRVILVDRKQQIWVGTEGGGITLLKPVGDTVVVRKHLTHKDNGVKNSNSVSDNRINYLFEDSEGFIWIGTGNGLDRYDVRTGEFSHFSAASGLAQATIAGIIEDDNGYLWISHKRGISRLNKKTLEVRNYTLYDGLQSNEFTDGACFRSRFTNKLYFGGNNGFNVFNPDSIIPDKTIPNTVLTSLEILNHKVEINEKINGRIILTKPLYLSNKINLNYSDKSIAIEFAGLHYSNPTGNKYAYMLDGFDQDWIYTVANRRLASYSNLEPGDYKFKVMSSNSDGIWNKKPTVLEITVNPPFWATWWAYLIYLILLSLALYVYYYYTVRVNKLRTQLSYEVLVREKENELHQSKLQFFTNISHEIKTPLTLILAPIEKLIDVFKSRNEVLTELTVMQANGNRLLKLINQLLDFRRLESGHMQLMPQQNDIIVLIKDIIRSFEPLAQNKDIEIKFETAFDSFYAVYDEDKIEKVISNLLSNALKFTPKGAWIKVVCDIKSLESEKLLLLQVVNLGKGIPPDDIDAIFQPFVKGTDNNEEGTGVGLAYVKGLVELHGGTIRIADNKITENTHETSFIIELPVKRQLKDINYLDERKASELGSGTFDQHPEISDERTAPEKGQQILINGKLPTLLIVEDNPDLRRYLREYFEGKYKLLEAENGLAGLELANHHLPDVIISDVMMPEMSGLELCEKIKSDLKTAYIPVILLTAKSPIEDRIEGLEMGADDYITKPFNLAFISAKVKNLLESRNTLKEKYRKEISIEPKEDIPLSPDEILLKKLLQYVEDNISDSTLNIDDICSNVGISRTQLYRKIKAMTGLSMAEVIKEMRLKRAKQLLNERKFNINEITYMVGFSDPDYFRKCFKSEFGVTPSEFYKHNDQ